MQWSDKIVHGQKLFGSTWDDCGDIEIRDECKNEQSLDWYLQAKHSVIDVNPCCSLLEDNNSDDDENMVSSALVKRTGLPKVECHQDAYGWYMKLYQDVCNIHLWREFYTIVLKGVSRSEEKMLMLGYWSFQTLHNIHISSAKLQGNHLQSK